MATASVCCSRADLRADVGVADLLAVLRPAAAIPRPAVRPRPVAAAARGQSWLPPRTGSSTLHVPPPTPVGVVHGASTGDLGNISFRQTRMHG